MPKTSVLIVDDESINRMLLNEYLVDAGYDPVAASGGEEALDILNKEPDRFAAVLLDRMMPGIDGLTVLKKLKATPALQQIPVIMQTAKAMKSEIHEGLECGSYYYLTKPFDRKTLLTILKAAVEQFKAHSTLISELTNTASTLSLMTEGTFECQTLEEARSLAKLIAIGCPDPNKTVTGLSELMINAIEHGNLGITYDEKTDLLKDDSFYDEIEIRLQLEENKSKKINVKFSRTSDEITFVITDQGIGFDYKNFIDINLSQVLDSHGRGIAMAKLLSFSNIEYQGCGNQVIATISI